MENVRQPIFAPANNGALVLPDVLGRVDLDELFTDEFLFPDEDVQRAAQASTGLARDDERILQAVMGFTSVGGDEVVPDSVEELCTPQTLPPDVPTQARVALDSMSVMLGMGAAAPAGAAATLPAPAGSEQGQGQGQGQEQGQGQDQPPPAAAQGQETLDVVAAARAAVAARLPPNMKAIAVPAAAATTGGHHSLGAAPVDGGFASGGRKRQRVDAQLKSGGSSNEGEGEDAAAAGPLDETTERRLRNREHAKRSRIRKKFMLESLQNQLTELRATNRTLRGILKNRLGPKADSILDECTEAQSTVLLTKSAQASAPKQTKTIMEQDFRLISALQKSQQCFAISDPSLPDNPIVFASPGFMELTGYTMQQIIGRNCRFLQGPGTDQRSVQMIRDAMREERDVSVCLLNYKADGTPFWNQFFIAPLRGAGNGEIVNYVGVQCEVKSAHPEEIMKNVRTMSSTMMGTDK